jgi:aspartate dehydrogenase
MSVALGAPATLAVGLAGFGNVGQDLAKRLTSGVIPEAKLVAVSAVNLARAEINAASLTPRPRVVPLAELPALVDVVVECATAGSFPEIARATLQAGKMLICVSAGGVPNCPDMLELARRHGGRVKIASGAMPGLDIIRSAKEGTIRRVHLRSRIRPGSMAHEKYVRDRGFDFERNPPTEPVKIFEGTAGEAAAAFPRHFNVAVTLSLGGVGFDRTSVEIWIQQDIPGAVHEVTVESDDIDLTLISRNRPSPNPRTSRIVCPSILAALRAIVDPVLVGS